MSCDLVLKPLTFFCTKQGNPGTAGQPGQAGLPGESGERGDRGDAGNDGQPGQTVSFHFKISCTCR